MQIETYEIEEINSSEASTMASDSESIELIDKLGLTGQRKLVNTETATRFPYPRLTTVQKVVFKALFPTEAKLQDFAAEIIPLRVLQVAAFCKDFPQTAWLEVWHSPIAKQDPILIGKPERWSSEGYLLARWGIAVLPFSELQVKAKEILRVQYTKKVQAIKRKVQAMEEMLDISVEEAVLTGNEMDFSTYV